MDSEIDSVIGWLRDRGAESIKHPGGSLLDHLVRVAHNRDDDARQRATTFDVLAYDVPI
ncbi:hypothetical protein HG717_33835 [Rhodococcus erythropolis]|uniref:hypothetical protein n=1 Tax=Rhodococcus erythropolis TaxID=1833 RepID=UPI001C9A9F66|nr:hypothetical protein [Rhodococcus erythropolis]MBY6388854.1 hypothetical protein [Rhodococcus erythropolis]